MYYPILVLYTRILKLEAKKIEEMGGKIYAIGGRPGPFAPGDTSKDFTYGQDEAYCLDLLDTEEDVQFLHKYLVPSSRFRKIKLFIKYWWQCKCNRRLKWILKRFCLVSKLKQI